MGKYDKYFITETPPNPILPETRILGAHAMFTSLYINDELNGKLKDAFWVATNLVTRAGEDSPGNKPNCHDWDEYLLFIGTNPEDPLDLGGEVEFWVEGEKHIITKTTALFIPAGMYHLPYYFRRVDRPFVFVSTGNTLRYRHLSYSKDPKYDHMLEADDDKVGLPPIVKKAVWKSVKKGLR